MYQNKHMEETKVCKIQRFFVLFYDVIFVNRNVIKTNTWRTKVCKIQRSFVLFYDVVFVNANVIKTNTWRTKVYKIQKKIVLFFDVVFVNVNVINKKHRFFCFEKSGRPRSQNPMLLLLLFYDIGQFNSSL